MGILALLFVVIVGVTFVGSVMGIIAYTKISKLQHEVRLLRQRFDGRAKHFNPKESREQTPRSEVLSSPDLLAKNAPSTSDPHATNSDKVAAKASAVSALQEPRPAAKTQATRPLHKRKFKVSKRTFEEEIGARWAVWVGGIALAFGAIFLLRYTIEAGVFTPAMRIALAALLGGVSLGAGEYLRRVDGGGAKLPGALAQLNRTAYIPGVLTGVGIFAMLGTVYAAYMLYGFIGPVVTFMLLGLISMGALALSLLHGPRLAALGLIASLVTPLLVSTTTPQYFVLFAYLITVCVAALALAWKRDWGWLNVLTLFGALGWSFISFEAADKPITYGAWLIFTGFMFVTSTALAHNFENKQERAKPPKALEHNHIAAIIWAWLAAILMLMVAANQPRFEFPHAHFAIGFGFVLMAAGWRLPRQKANIIIGACLVTYAIWVGANADFGLTQSLSLAGITVIIASALSFLAASKVKENRQRLLLWSGFGSLLPIAMIVRLNTHLDGFTDQGTSVVLFAAAFANGVQSWWLWQKVGDKPYAVSVYAGGAALAYTLAVLFGFSGLTETGLLIAGILISAGLYTKFPIFALRWIASGFAGLSAAHTLYIRIPDADAIGGRIVFNEMWIYFALPALVCAAAAFLLARKDKDIWSEGLKALALTFTALFFVFQVRHFMNGGNVLAGDFGFDEIALQVLVGLSFTLGGTLLGRARPQADKTKPKETYENLIPSLAMIVSLATLVLFVLAVCLLYNPLLAMHAISLNGGIVFNSLALAYLLPALLLATIAHLSKDNRPKVYVQTVWALSFGAFMLYITTMVRFIFVGRDISLLNKFPKDGEMYAISAVWLVFGILLLVAGLKFKRKDIRMASALVITLTVFKAFLIDMASLDGPLRAMSFVVLGIVLIGIGRVYQKLLFSRTNSPDK